MLMAEMFADDISADPLSQMHRHRRKYARCSKGTTAPGCACDVAYERIRENDLISWNLLDIRFME